ncbi:MAG: hypothetical protein FJX42_09385 [Alphaproteobacteria bacterium]|nr:hypothetical protein [Alphaproteobacteria bacterium]
MRMRTLALALRENGAVVMAASREDSVGIKILAEAGLETCQLPQAPDAADLAAASQAFRPDLTIVDTLKTEEADLAALRGNGRMVVFDDWGAGLQTADAVINAIVFHWGRYRREDVRGRLCEGPDYMILSPDMIKAPRRAASAPVGRRLFIAFGGTDTRDLAARVPGILDRVPGPLEIRINLGPGAAGIENVRATADRSPHRITVLSGVPSLADEFVQADLVLCGGGNMLYELAALGVPAVALATEDHEIANIRYWSGIGSALDLGAWSALDEGRTVSTVAALLGDRERRSAMSAAGRKAVDGRGLERCLAVIDSLAA